MDKAPAGLSPARTPLQASCGPHHATTGVNMLGFVLSARKIHVCLDSIACLAAKHVSSSVCGNSAFYLKSKWGGCAFLRSSQVHLGQHPEHTVFEKSRLLVISALKSCSGRTLNISPPINSTKLPIKVKHIVLQIFISSVLLFSF